MNLRTIHSLLPLGLIALAVGCASNSSKPANSPPAAEARAINFADAKYGVRLVYPAEWKPQSFFKPREALLLVTRGEGEALSLIAKNDPQHPTTSADLPTIAEGAVEKYRAEFSDFKLLEQSDATMGGEPARRIVFVGKKLGITFQTMNVLSSHKGTAYALLYMADPASFEAGRPGVQKVIDSVEFAK